MNLMHLIPLSCLAVASATGDSGVPGSHKTVKVEVGDDAILPCQLETPYDKKTQKVEWTRNDKDVHLYRNEKDDLTDQDQHFKGRTALFHDEMAKGNISLKLSKVNERDEGNYTCRVDSSQDPQCNILLSVENKSNTEEWNKPEPEPETKPELTTFWGNLGFIALVIPVIAIFVFSIWWKCRNNNAVPNRDNELEPLRERNGENQRDSDMVGPEPEPEAEPEAEPEPEPEAQPVPGPNHDDGTSVSPYRRGHNKQNNQGEEPGQ
ncbi:myelin-oligodendrocyte glycoprotein-like [Epinephelus fuscoguttatus]|uniref:myelin-oligodendrocyte glycoprotein-like n=1 Tax=Epinephelus fuscoguttatus TaxID=293821 RepID=UPI0020D173A2|nr:myelin-oligodendrocyte glycoprotein-like [Epinephelus fuscoguttatus]